MNRKEAIQTLKELRRYAVGRDWACDVEALTAGIEALEAQEAARQPVDTRATKMLDQILGIVADMMHEDDRPMFDAILTYWRIGRKTMTPIERVALDDRRRDWRIGAGLGNLNKVRATVSQVGLLMLEDVHPEIKEEAQTNDGNA